MTEAVTGPATDAPMYVLGLRVTFPIDAPM
jgi:hypothetical protein